MGGPATRRRGQCSRGSRSGSAATRSWPIPPGRRRAWPGSGGEERVQLRERAAWPTRRGPIASYTTSTGPPGGYSAESGSHTSRGRPPSGRSTWIVPWGTEWPTWPNRCASRSGSVNAFQTSSRGARRRRARARALSLFCPVGRGRSDAVLSRRGPRFVPLPLEPSRTRPIRRMGRRELQSVQRRGRSRRCGARRIDVGARAQARARTRPVRCR